MKEGWRPVVGYEGLYSVSSEGRVRRDWDPQGRACGILKLNPIRGYEMVSLSREGFSKRFMVHRLVTGAFIGPLPEGHQVHHGNGQRADNRLRNLEYLTASANVKRTYEAGRQALRGEANGHATITDAQALEMRRLFAAGVSQAEIGRRLAVSKYTVFNVVRRKTWRHL